MLFLLSSKPLQDFVFEGVPVFETELGGLLFLLDTLVCELSIACIFLNDWVKVFHVSCTFDLTTSQQVET